MESAIHDKCNPWPPRTTPSKRTPSTAIMCKSNAASLFASFLLGGAPLRHESAVVDSLASREREA